MGKVLEERMVEDIMVEERMVEERIIEWERLLRKLLVSRNSLRRRLCRVSMDIRELFTRWWRKDVLCLTVGEDGFSVC